MPPTFTKSLKRVDGNVGNDVCMDCRLSGSQPMTIVWFKDDQEVLAGSKYQPEFKDNSATLHIVGLQKNDSGVYKCRATNSAGLKETSGTLYVKGHKAIQESIFAFCWFDVCVNMKCNVFSLWPPEPPVFTVKLVSQDVLPGTTVALKAAFTGTAPLAVKWFREDKEVVTGGSYFIRKDASSSSLELHAVKPADSAKYTCQVSNDAGRVDCTATLFVKGADFPVYMHERVSAFFGNTHLASQTNVTIFFLF